MKVRTLPSYRRGVQLIMLVSQAPDNASRGGLANGVAAHTTKTQSWLKLQIGSELLNHAPKVINEALNTLCIGL